MGIPRLKREGNSKLGYCFKGAVESKRTDLTVRTMKRSHENNSPGHVYDITTIMIVVAQQVGGDEIGVGDVRVPGFANAPES